VKPKASGLLPHMSPVRITMLVAVPVLMFGLLGLPLSGGLPAATAKLRGKGRGCSWGQVFLAPYHNKTFAELDRGFQNAVAVTAQDDTFNIELVKSPERSFWIKRGPDERWDGQGLLAYLLSEHSWMASINPKDTVRRGDVVLDCGAHVGVFTYRSLLRGASQVVAIEPDPVNLECLRRNFSREIASGRVVLVPKGVWSSVTTLSFSESKLTSGSNSFVSEQGGAKMELSVTTIDELVKELHLPRVDYVKMDIEGSEREALKGAHNTIRTFRPRLMLDMYHRPDDPGVLPALIQDANTAYVSTCGPCEMDNGQLVPHVTFFK
jgi:FkbM family methyltransferase